jgi:hypothetical protein
MDFVQNGPRPFCGRFKTRPWMRSSEIFDFLVTKRGANLLESIFRISQQRNCKIRESKVFIVSLISRIKIFSESPGFLKYSRAALSPDRHCYAENNFRFDPAIRGPFLDQAIKEVLVLLRVFSRDKRGRRKDCVPLRIGALLLRYTHFKMTDIVLVAKIYSLPLPFPDAIFVSQKLIDRNFCISGRRCGGESVRQILVLRYNFQLLTKRGLIYPHTYPLDYCSRQLPLCPSTLPLSFRQHFGCWPAPRVVRNSLTLPL